MGTDDEVPVAEPTEPPICGYKEHQKDEGVDPHTTHPAAPPTRAEKAQQAPWPTSTGENPPPYASTISELVERLQSNVQNGLTKAEATARLERDGPNKVEGGKGISLWEILLRQVSNTLTLVLVIVMILSFAIHDYIEGAVISAVIALNIAVGLVQDYRAEQTIQSLYVLSAPTCKIIRDGQNETIKAAGLVKGDIVLLAVGDIVPADIRLVESINLSTDEALLTGESLPISKHAELVLADADVPVGDRTNMVFSASTITRGRAKGIVTDTGMSTEVGRIAELLRSGHRKETDSGFLKRTVTRAKKAFRSIMGFDGTPLQVKLSKFALILFGLAILLAVIVFSVNLWDVDDEVLIYGICVGVAVIPESLIAVLTITMAVGTKAMAKGNVIVRKLSALEAVGGVTNICSDKTGTLTQGKMIARKVWLPNGGIVTVEGSTDPLDPTSGSVIWEDAPDQVQAKDPEKSKSSPLASPQLLQFLRTIALCNNATITDSKGGTSDLDSVTTDSTPIVWTALGEPTEVALQVFAMRFGMGKTDTLLRQPGQLVSEFPFDSSVKRMTVVYNDGSGVSELYTKGAVEAILPLLNETDEKKVEIAEKADVLAAEGLRVLCVAYKFVEGEIGTEREHAECGLSFAGLAGLYDPPRLETADAVKKCKRAGIAVHMLTGDHIKTAITIAREVGILDFRSSPEQQNASVMPASQFDALSDEQIDEMENLPLVLARCSPSTKVRMVEAMHRRKAFCVMTGDGVNDSPALKQSDVGIAMGKNGSDVAKEAADMVLTDDNFASIVTAVEEGRRLFDNIQKFLLHLLISNISQVILLLIGLSFQDRDNVSVFPLSPLEILWVNLITSSFLALGLGLEEAQPDIMLQKPHNLRIGVFTKELIIDKFVYGFFMGALCLAAFTSVAYGVGGPEGLGFECNAGWNDTCGVVFRARATTYATLSFLLLVTAWEVKHFTRSLFNMMPEVYTGPFSVFKTVYRNKFLFGAVVAGFVITFPVIYLPVVNRVVFKHTGITWEWGVVAACLVVYVCLVEMWKAVKRRFGWGSQRVVEDVDEVRV